MCTGGGVPLRVPTRMLGRVRGRVIGRMRSPMRITVRVTRRLLLHMRHLAQHHPTQRRREERDCGEDRSEATKVEVHARGSGKE